MRAETDGVAIEDRPTPLAISAALKPTSLCTRLNAARDQTPLIIKGDLDPKSPDKLCAATLELFVVILGADAGNLALKTIATGGVYLGGGIPPRILPALEDGRFIAAFRRKGRFAELLEGVPVHVLIEPVPLIGAAAYCLAAVHHDDPQLRIRGEVHPPRHSSLAMRASLRLRRSHDQAERTVTNA